MGRNREKANIAIAILEKFTIYLLSNPISHFEEGGKDGKGLHQDHGGGSTDINLAPAARQSIQYVRWDILKVNIASFFHIQSAKILLLPSK